MQLSEIDKSWCIAGSADLSPYKIKKKKKKKNLKKAVSSFATTIVRFCPLSPGSPRKLSYWVL